jgi:hypothetical protein
MAEHHNEVHSQHGVDRDRLDENFMNTHHLAYTGGYKKRDGTIIEGDISVKLRVLEDKVK